MKQSAPSSTESLESSGLPAIQVSDLERQQRGTRLLFRVKLLADLALLAYHFYSTPTPNYAVIALLFADLVFLLPYHFLTRPGARTEIVASDIADEMSVLLSDGPALEGEIFQAAQAVLAAKAFPQPDGQVRIQLIPEVHYGESKMRYVNTLGAIRIEPGRSRRTFDRLAIDAVLAPGHMLVLGAVSDRPGSLGYRFFTQTTSGQLEHKLLIVRLAQTQHDELFGPADPAPLDLTL